MTAKTPTTTLTLASTVTDALEAMRSAGGHHVVIEAHGRPVGVVGIEELLAHRDEPDGTERPLRDVISWQCVHVPPDADAQVTLATYRQAAWDYLLHRHRPA